MGITGSMPKLPASSTFVLGVMQKKAKTFDVCVYYCSTYYKAVRVGEGDSHFDLIVDRHAMTDVWTLVDELTDVWNLVDEFLKSQMTSLPVPEAMEDGKWEWDRCMRAVNSEGMTQTLSCKDAFASVSEERRIRAVGLAREGEREGGMRLRFRVGVGVCWWGGEKESLLGTVT